MRCRALLYGALWCLCGVLRCLYGALQCRVRALVRSFDGAVIVSVSYVMYGAHPSATGRPPLVPGLGWVGGWRLEANAKSITSANAQHRGIRTRDQEIEENDNQGQ